MAAGRFSSVIFNRRVSFLQLAVSFSAAATMGFAQFGVLLRLRRLRIFPFSMCNTSLGFGILPAAGSASALLS